jgi:hypothetical protein
MARHCGKFKIETMNKRKTSLAILPLLLIGTIFTGCQSPAQKEKAARNNVLEARQDLKELQNEANAEAKKVANAQEWETFKYDSEIVIRNNEIRIAELRVKLNKPGTTLDPIYEKKIVAMEQQNKDLKKRIEDYEKSQSDWEIFKREFNHDMEELGKALKDLTVNNKN